MTKIIRKYENSIEYCCILLDQREGERDIFFNGVVLTQFELIKGVWADNKFRINELIKHKISGEVFRVQTYTAAPYRCYFLYSGYERSSLDLSFEEAHKNYDFFDSF